MKLVSSATSLLIVLIGASSCRAQVSAVSVGITPTCPYGLNGCWGGAYEALGHLEGVRSVARTPDAYNCMADVVLDHDGLPNVRGWEKQFLARTNGVYHFRGVEITVSASVQRIDGGLTLTSPQIKDSVRLAPLSTFLHWNFKKRAPRQPEPGERDAYRDLEAARIKAKTPKFFVDITGPLRHAERGFILEVREFFELADPNRNGAD